MLIEVPDEFIEDFKSLLARTIPPWMCQDDLPDGILVWVKQFLDADYQIDTLSQKEWLISEKCELTRMLSTLSKSSVIDRMSLESRKRKVEKQLGEELKKEQEVLKKEIEKQENELEEELNGS